MIYKLLSIGVILFLINFNSLSQDFIYTQDFQFLGYDGGDPVFRIYEDEFSKDLYKIESDEKGQMGFYQYGSTNFPTFEIEFLYDSLVVRRYRENDQFKNILMVGNSTFQFINWSIGHSLYSQSKNRIFIFISKDSKYGVLEFDLNNKNPIALRLPIKADRGYIQNDWLYFSFFHEQYEYSPWPHDIFRVKIGDWQNPELVFQCSEYDEWFLYPESHVIATDIELNDREMNRNNQILYNVEQAAYAIVPNITVSGSSSSYYLKYKGNYYGYFSNEGPGVETIGLELLPPIPEKYSSTEHFFHPREAWYNLPLKEKNFPGTFITPYLLREASESELLKLEKSQLRLLRNAIYAQYGYIFNSKDLQEFYNQFEWYRMMTVRKEDNEDVVLLPEDKDRAELIREVENRK